MQPPFQIRAISERFKPYSSSCEAARSMDIAWAYEMIMPAYNASRTSATSDGSRGPDAPLGPRSTFDAATRSALNAEMLRPQSAASMFGIGTPRSAAFCEVHL